MFFFDSYECFKREVTKRRSLFFLAAKPQYFNTATTDEITALSLLIGTERAVHSLCALWFKML